jgi:hypothetical protein
MEKKIGETEEFKPVYENENTTAKGFNAEYQKLTDKFMKKLKQGDDN